MAMKPRKMIARNAGKKTEEMGTRTRGGNMSKKAEEEMGPRGSGAVKKMRGGGMVKKMRGGGMVKKMRGGGMVKKMKKGGAA